jgi:hypothetical protein
MLIHPFNHVRKRILRVGVLAVRIDADETHTAIHESLRGLAGGFIRASYVGAVIAGEENDQDLGVIEIGQGVRATVGGG